jgi:transposase-like protein
MKTSKLENPHIRSEVVRRFAGGETQAAIARDFGVHRSQVSRFAKREDIRPSIETEQLKLPESVPDAVENVKDLVTAMKDIPKDDTKRRELSYRASQDTLKMVGIMPSPIRSQVITTIYNDQRNQIMSLLIQGMLKKIVGEQSGD